MRIIVFAFVLLGAWAPVAASGPEVIFGQASVVDGDTITIVGQNIRLNGIDAPEGAQSCFDPDQSNWPCGRRAAFALADRIGRLNVSCTKLGTDRWKRPIARCSLGNVDLQEWMVANGWALAYRRYSRDYIAAEAVAKTAKAGLWVGTFQAPWDWRRDRDSPLYGAQIGPPQ